MQLEYSTFNQYIFYLVHPFLHHILDIRLIKDQSDSSFSIHTTDISQASQRHSFCNPNHDLQLHWLKNTKEKGFLKVIPLY